MMCSSDERQVGLRRAWTLTKLCKEQQRLTSLEDLWVTSSNQWAPLCYRAYQVLVKGPAITSFTCFNILNNMAFLFKVVFPIFEVP